MLAAGCTIHHGDEVATSDHGIAEIQVDAASLQASNVTRVAMSAAGASQDLALNPATGTFDGALGVQAVVATAFSGDVQVGMSRPTSVVVTPGEVTRVMLRILDTTGSAPPLFGPIFDSLSYPTATQVGDAATFTISVVAPAGDPVSYGWTSSCADSTFSAPASATTSWSRATAGSCTISVAATSNGFTVTRSFAIVVFPAGARSGAVSATGVFVRAPLFELTAPGANCDAVTDSTQDGSCVDPIASPGTTPYMVNVFGWGISTPGSIALSDSCGGVFGRDLRTDGFVKGNWLPPVAGGVCLITARVVNGDEVASTLSVAVLVHPGIAATSQPPEIDFDLNGFCFVSAVGTNTVDCGPLGAGTAMSLFGHVSWLDGLPGSVTVNDECGTRVVAPDDSTFLTDTWTESSTPGTTCTTTVQATSLQGSTSQASAVFHLR